MNGEKSIWTERRGHNFFILENVDLNKPIIFPDNTALHDIQYMASRYKFWGRGKCNLKKAVKILLIFWIVLLPLQIKKIFKKMKYL